MDNKSKTNNQIGDIMSYKITIYFHDGSTKTHSVTCNCPIDWVVDNYDHDSFDDFTFYQI